MPRIIRTARASFSRITNTRVGLGGGAVRSAAVLLLAGATTLAACSGLSQDNPTANHYGAINIVARGSVGARASANATVVFFDAFSVAVPSSQLQQTDQCTYANVDTISSVTKGVIRGSNSISLAVGSNALALPYDSTLLRYATPFTYISGDVAQVTLAGAVGLFPSAAISVRLAEPVIPGAVAVPASGFPLVVTWTPSTDTTGAMILAVKYANPATSSYGNEEIFCTLKDDGRFDVPASGLAFFLASPNAMRSLQLTRYRTNETLIDSKTLLHIATSVDTTVKFP